MIHPAIAPPKSELEKEGERMGAAEDAIRRRQQQEAANSRRAMELNQQRARELFPLCKEAAQQLARELDRLGWPSSSITTLITQGGAREMAFYVGVSGVWGVGSDGNPYMLSASGSNGYGEPSSWDWSELSSPEFIAADTLESLNQGLRRHIDKLRTR